MKVFLSFLLLLFIFQKSTARQTDSTRTLMVGDSINIAVCPSGGFKHIQLYTKTRFPSDGATTYNKETGDDFYEYFFTTGDFDVKMLPCIYGNKKYKITSIRVFADKKTGADRPVLFIEVDSKTVIWVEQSAVLALEVYVN